MPPAAVQSGSPTRLQTSRAAADLGDPDGSTCHGNIHPPDKQPLGYRLHLLARKLVLNETGGLFAAPLPVSCACSAGADVGCTIEFSGPVAVSAPSACPPPDECCTGGGGACIASGFEVRRAGDSWQPLPTGCVANTVGQHIAVSLRSLRSSGGGGAAAADHSGALRVRYAHSDFPAISLHAATAAPPDPSRALSADRTRLPVLPFDIPCSS